MAKELHPKLIVGGASAYPRVIDFERMARIAHDNGALFMVDMAHIAGLVATGAHPSPVPYADIVTTTTHKTLRGPRGGLILTNDEALAKKINSRRSGSQGGPLMHVIAGKAVALGEALKPEFKTYIDNVGEELVPRWADGHQMAVSLRLVAKAIDNHQVIDLTPADVTGKDAEKLLESVGLTVNKNTIPNEPCSPFEERHSRGHGSGHHARP